MASVSNLRLYERLSVSPAELQEFCERSPITELAFFGSILREDFNSNSDIDVLVRLVSDSSLSLMDLVGLEYQFENLFHRKVDLVEREAVESDHNWIRRSEILSSTQIAYESRPILAS